MVVARSNCSQTAIERRLNRNLIVVVNYTFHGEYWTIVGAKINAAINIMIHAMYEFITVKE